MSMFKTKNFTNHLNIFTVIACLASFANVAFSADVQEIHFLIPGGESGGWDMTARITADMLVEEKIVQQVYFQNLSGAGGGKAIAHIIGTAEQQQNTLMISSCPILIRSLSSIFTQSYKNLTPVAAIIADYSAMVVTTDSKYTDWQSVVIELRKDSRHFKIAGGSVRGGMDHLVAAAAFKGEGLNPQKLRYLAYDAGGEAMTALLSGKAALLSTGLGEALKMSNAGKVRLLAITAPERLAVAANVPTLKEMGNETIFVNWRGFFAAPDISQDKVEAWNQVLKKLHKTDLWKKTLVHHGWIDNYKNSQDFKIFLNEQEKQIHTLMQELGFIK